MGTKFSLNKDYNRTLARQPPKPIRISQFQVPDNLEQEPLVGTLSIPVPVRNTQVNHQTPASTEKTLLPKSEPASIQSNIRSVIDQQTESHSEKPLVHRSSPITLQTNPIMNRNPVIISRSVVNLDDNNNRINHFNLPKTFSSFRSNRSIVERNGNQFLTEIKHRMEQRYVQVYDDNQNQMRLFEVTDYIPSRTIRSLNFNRQFQGQSNRFSQHSMRPNLSLSHRLPLPPKANSRRELNATPSKLVNFNDLNNRDTLNHQFDLYHNGILYPSNPQTSIPSYPAIEHQRSRDSDDNYTQPEPYNPTSVVSQGSQNQYTPQPSFLRKPSPTQSEHSQTGSENSHTESKYSHSESDENSIVSNDDDNDSEGIDRTLPSNRRQSNHNSRNRNISYGTLGERKSSEQIDLFKRTVNPRDSYYSKRSDFNSYSQPIMNNRGLQSNTTTDYTPIRLSH